MKRFFGVPARYVVWIDTSMLVLAVDLESRHLTSVSLHRWLFPLHNLLSSCSTILSVCTLLPHRSRCTLLSAAIWIARSHSTCTSIYYPIVFIPSDLINVHFCNVIHPWSYRSSFRDWWLPTGTAVLSLQLSLPLVNFTKLFAHLDHVFERFFVDTFPDWRSSDFALVVIFIFLDYLQSFKINLLRCLRLFVCFILTCG